MRLSAEDPDQSPRVVLLNEDDEETDADPRTASRRDAVTAALRAAIGPLAMAFACQGNWLMRRQVLALARASSGVS